MKPNYISIARMRRTLALKFLEKRDADLFEWDEFVDRSAALDVGNLTPHQLLAFQTQHPKPTTES